MNFTTQEKTLLCKILSYDCTYLEDITEEEFQIYQTLRRKIDEL
tara:strand:+ start:54 stop:185 length:132 start_codon:yes stop_codon:yes gene_type:complete